eukprot:jgi/Tetstr1/452456/TSEL_039492.t1
MKRIALATTALSALVAPGAIAQDAPANGNSQQVDVLQHWSYDPLYSDGISIDRMLYGADVFGPTGDDIGSIENVVFSDSGEALAIIAQVGGFWDIGDTHVSVPWDEVEVDRNSPSVSIPVTEENASDYSMFGEGGWFDEQTYFAQDAESLQAVDDDLVAGPSVFLASEFMGDYAYLDGDRAYGYVSDLIVAEGQLTGIVVDAASYYGTPGYYAYPYDREGMDLGWNPADRRYSMPYGEAQITELDSFDYDRMGGP